MKVCPFTMRTTMEGIGIKLNAVPCIEEKCEFFVVDEKRCISILFANYLSTMMKNLLDN